MLGVALLGFTAVAVMWRPVLLSWRENRLAEARRDFHWQRERLEAKFLSLGMMPNRPEDARWNDCWFDDDVAYARSRTSGELSAFVAVRIRLETPADPMLVDMPWGIPAATPRPCFVLTAGDGIRRAVRSSISRLPKRSISSNATWR